MSAFPDTGSIQDIATELNIDSVFLEKDWHVSNVIKALSEFKHDTFEAVFCGGTSLLKGHKVIQRFSEDVDFRILNISGEKVSRAAMKEYRDALFDHLSKIPELTFDFKNFESRDGSRKFTIKATYSKRFGDHASIRPELKLEGNFVEETFPGLEAKEIKPIIGDYLEVENQSSILCLSLLETTADKVSALVWRVLSRNRGEENDDPTIIRHLFDIHSLLPHFKTHDEVLASAELRYQEDKKRGHDQMPENFSAALSQAIEILETDSEYSTEYGTYALNMCFGENIKTAYEEALSSLALLKK
jgi:predicted nucleotidyltransferase component of viral defense system